MPVTRKKDTQGSYYQYGNHGKKYYYIPNNKSSRELAKAKALRQERAAHVIHPLIHGEGIIQNIRNRFQPRNGPSPQFRNFLLKEGNQEVKSMYVARTPVHSGIQAFLDALSGGRFSKVKKRLNYNDIYHNYLIIQTKDGKKFKVERNHIVEATPVTNRDLTNEKREIPIHKDITVNKLIQSASDKNKNFWKYDPENNNCQVFTKEVVSDSNLDTNLDHKAQEILQPQSANALLDSLGSLKFVPKLITDTASTTHHVVYGEGIRKHNLTVNELFHLVNHQQ